jgi:hypothetical protein
MPRYKRTADDAQLDAIFTPEVAPQDVETLQKLRNMWEFASLMQYIFLFGHVVKIDDDLDIEVGIPPRRCLKPAVCCAVLVDLDADEDLMTGPGSRMFEDRAFSTPCSNRLTIPKICVVPSRPDVCLIKSPCILRLMY